MTVNYITYFYTVSGMVLPHRTRAPESFLMKSSFSHNNQAPLLSLILSLVWTRGTNSPCNLHYVAGPWSSPFRSERSSAAMYLMYYIVFRASCAFVKSYCSWMPRTLLFLVQYPINMFRRRSRTHCLNLCSWIKS